ncbi:MAG: DUF5518 domain-containing protein [Acidobacteria bacterium]|nr:DUF5518 domain-containing protein [Acidobacteriota bacterium]
MKASKLQPALLGGVLMGVLSALPFVSVGNCCCCLWVVAGGLLAAYLLQQNQPTALDVGDGAVVGLLAGLIGAVIATVLAVPINLTMGPVQARILQRVMENVPNMPVEMRDAFDSARASGIGFLASAFSFMVMLVAGMVFSTVGGVIGAVLFRRGRPGAVTASDGPTPAV